MENIMQTFASRSKKKLLVSTAKGNQNLSKSETAIDKILKNQAIFKDIFGEDPPDWWGNFSAVPS